MSRHTRSILATALFPLFGFTLAAQTQRPLRAVENDPDLREVRDFRLTSEKVDKWASATQNLKKLADENPGLKENMDKDDNEKNITEIVQRMGKYPQAVTAIRTAGLSPREYVVMSMSLMQSVMAVGLKKQGLLKEYPTDTINPQNLAFVEQNFERLRQLMEQANAAGSEKGSGREDDSQ